MTTKEAAVKLGTLQGLAVVALRECCHAACGLRHERTDEEAAEAGEFMREGGKK